MTKAPQTAPAPPASIVVNVSLSLGLPRVEREPISIELTQVTGGAISTPRSSSPVQAIPLVDLAEDTGPNCFLQIWEMDEYSFKSYTDEETDRAAGSGNQLAASIKGILVRRASGMFEFQLPQNFVRPKFDRDLASANGFIRLRLRDTTNAERIINLHMPQYEKFFELGATIRTVADDTSYSRLTSQLPFQLRNEIASIRHQIKQRGGITISVCGNWRVDPAGITDKMVEEPVTVKVKGKEVPVIENGKPKTRWRKRYYKNGGEVCRRVLANGGGEVYFTSTNDAEFEGQAEETLSVLPSFIPDDTRTVKIGYHLFVQNDNKTLEELATKIQESRLAAGKALAENDAFLTSAAQGNEDADTSVATPALAQCPKVSTLLLLCHGWRDGLTIAGNETDSHMRKTRSANITSWVPTISPHCVPNLNLALYACLCGRGVMVKKSKSEPTMGRMFPAEELGFDSFAWKILREFKANGLLEPSIWAHTVAAHTTRNPFLRVFCSQGAGDFISIAKQAPRIDKFFETAGAFTTGEGWVHRGNIIREICTYHGGYLDWAWNGGQSITPATSWFDQSVSAEVGLIMEEVRKVLIADSPVVEEEFLFEDTTRKVITSINAAAFKPKAKPDPLLTRVLKLSHFPMGDSPFKLYVALVKGIQIVCDRVKDEVSEPLAEILEMRDEGQSAIIRGHTSANRTKILTKATDAVSQGFLTGAVSLSDGRVLVSVRVGGPTTISTPM